ncbi:3'-5' exonuclease [Deinococcus yavapaiensis]|uniref:Inhibitor of KinA sporulation pathway (Predicted exonuclease) n=1 Tax=Deinococcus yavapaiensis KR-236 TaxID=694435 RepID=A0A318SA28_9DEIO|nr:3'-5' exonuclease [Deinococcus yavapaiensis]PYE53932.1 inhibitor of KinA sporulation pathway (predicted exonuclease) [Deinococcus yavapaiensis KR-236]
MSEAFGRSLNVVDVEATCWQDEAPSGQVSEIIEIGLTVVDLHERRRASKHRLLVKPTRSDVSEFCTHLTGLTREEVDRGMSFADACRTLRSEFHADSCATRGVPYPFSSRHTNAKATYAAFGMKKRLGMAQALQHAELPLEGRHHRGEDDAWNIAALVLRLVERGAWPL